MYENEDNLLAMKRSPVKDVEIKVLLKAALTDKINDREVYMKGIDPAATTKVTRLSRLKTSKIMKKTKTNFLNPLDKSICNIYDYKIETVMFKITLCGKINKNSMKERF